MGQPGVLKAGVDLAWLSRSWLAIPSRTTDSPIPENEELLLHGLWGSQTRPPP